MDRENKLELLKANMRIVDNLTMEQLVKQVILRTFDNIKTLAEENQVCKRKAVGAAILEVNFKDQEIRHFTAINGPSSEFNKCKNIVGACGCSHAEPRVIMEFLKKSKRNGHRGKTILLSTYSPCVNCANIAIDSGIIDVFAYEILAEHWAKEPNNALAIIERSSIRLWTKEQIEKDGENERIKYWLYK